jgi:hypothetical protein
MARTIYFSGSITGGRHDVATYRRIVAALREGGHRVLAGSVAAEEVSDTGDALTPDQIFSRDIGWLDEVARSKGLLVAEVSTPSTGVGYEIAAARYRYGMPVICLYRSSLTKKCSAMVAGDREIRVIDYSESGLEAMLSELLDAVAAVRE